MSEDAQNRTMADVSHANPYTGETFGTGFRRGPTVAADGGREDGRDAGATMRAVDHTPPHGEGANRVWERGTETTEVEATSGAEAASEVRSVMENGAADE